MRAMGQTAGTPAPNPAVAWDRWTLLTAVLLLVFTAAAWAIMLTQPMAAPPSGSSMGMSGAAMVSLAGAVAFLGAWGVMMAAMMLPSATPMIAFYGAIQRNAAKTGQRGIPTAAFALVYLALWAAIGAPIYLASVALGMASGNRAVASALPYALALVLIVAGAYQFSPLKRACLHSCQSPLAFLMGHWRTGRMGTLVLALDHAVRCFGCCWALMVVLVAAGAMSLPWVLLITVVVSVEKLAPASQWAARVAGGALVLLGLFVAVQPSIVAMLRGGGM